MPAELPFASSGLLLQGDHRAAAPAPCTACSHSGSLQEGSSTGARLFAPRYHHTLCGFAGHFWGFKLLCAGALWDVEVHTLLLPPLQGHTGGVWWVSRSRLIITYSIFKSLYSNACMLQKTQNLKVAHGVAKLTKHRAAAQAQCQGAQPGSPSGNPIIWHG